MSPAPLAVQSGSMSAACSRDSSYLCVRAYNLDEVQLLVPFLAKLQCQGHHSVPNGKRRHAASFTPTSSRGQTLPRLRTFSSPHCGTILAPAYPVSTAKICCRLHASVVGVVLMFLVSACRVDSYSPRAPHERCITTKAISRRHSRQRGRQETRSYQEDPVLSLQHLDSLPVKATISSLSSAKAIHQRPFYPAVCLGGKCGSEKPDFGSREPLAVRMLATQISESQHIPATTPASVETSDS